MECKLYQVEISDGDSLIMKRISNDLINGVHKSNDPKLLRNFNIYQLRKYIASYYDKIWYTGVILECSNENQDVKVKFMTQKKIKFEVVKQCMI